MRKASSDLMDVYLAGEKLYGDDFDIGQLEAWYEKEKEGYSGIVQEREQIYRYSYHALNRLHGFQHILLDKGSVSLAIGGAFCHELLPVIDRLKRIINLDPSDHFDIGDLEGVPIKHIKANPRGKMPFADEEFDLITCFGVLHHIPNVSFVIEECYRCLKLGGYMLLREPIVSMGDWRQPRRGLTANERGIPFRILIEICESTGFRVIRQGLCDFSPLAKMGEHVGVQIYNNALLTRLDALLSKMFSWNIKYHRVNFRDKIAPASLSLVLTK